MQVQSFFCCGKEEQTDFAPMQAPSEPNLFSRTPMRLNK